MRSQEGKQTEKRRKRKRKNLENQRLLEQADLLVHETARLIRVVRASALAQELEKALNRILHKAGLLLHGVNNDLEAAVLLRDQVIRVIITRQQAARQGRLQTDPHRQQAVPLEVLQVNHRLHLQDQPTHAQVPLLKQHVGRQPHPPADPLEMHERPTGTLPEVPLGKVTVDLQMLERLAEALLAAPLVRVIAGLQPVLLVEAPPGEPLGKATTDLQMPVLLAEVLPAALLDRVTTGLQIIHPGVLRLRHEPEIEM